MIKKILLTLGIFLIGFINITFGVGEFVGQGKIGQYVLNPIDGDFYVGVDKNFNLKSIHNGEGKNIFVIYTGTLWGFYVSNDSGKNVSLYANQWRSDGPRGGVLTYYYLCDYVNDTTFTTFSGCVQGNYGDSVNIEYIAHLKVGDDYFFGSASLGSENHGTRRNPFIGFNISDLNKSIVFYAKAEKSVNIGYGLPYVYSDAYGVNRSYFTAYNWDTFSGGLVYNNPYDLTLNGCIGPNCDTAISPGGFSPVSGGYSYMSCTNQNVLAYYVKTFGYNGNMCNLQSGGVVDGYYPYGTLLEFCNIYYTFYNIDGTYLNQLYTGHNKNIVCDSSSAYFDYSGNNVSIDWSDEFPGVINGSGEYEVQSSDSFLINLTNILKGNFYLPESGDFGLGYLPRYIILGFMGVIFFNFIRK